MMRLAALAAMAVVALTAQADTRAIRGAAYVDADGQIVKGGLLVIDGEKIVQVGGEPPAGVAADVYDGAVLAPGLIDCHAALGAWGGLSERQDAVQPLVNARDAFDRYSRQLAEALAAGVTTFALAPDDRDLVGGRIAICQTAGPDGRPHVLSDAGPLKLSLSPAVFRPDRDPTSRSGALGILRATLAAARDEVGRSSTSPYPLAEFAGGRLTGFIVAPSGADVLASVELAQEFNIRLVPIHTIDARRIAEPAAGHVPGVIVGPLDLTSGPRAALAAGLFARQGIPVALAGGLPAAPADGLRQAAALAARAGLAPAAARRAITSVPAALLGVGDRLGQLAIGQQADIVVFSGDPLDLRSRVLAVYVGGRRAVVARAEGAQP